MPAEDESKAADIAEELRAEIASLRNELEDLRRQREADIDRVLREIAYDRQRLSKLETPADPTPSQKDRSEILRALLAANSGKMLSKEARQKMHLSKSQFSQLLASMNGDIELKPYHLDKRQKILQLK
jgi:signal transduction histidine kinase